MPKVYCTVINCSNSTYTLKKWKQEICYEHDFDSSCKRDECIHCIPPFKLYCFPSIFRNAELRNKWIRDKRKTKLSGNHLKVTGFALFILLVKLMKQVLFQLLIWDMKSKKRKQEGL